MVQALGDARADPRDDVLGERLAALRARGEPDVPERLAEEQLHRDVEALRGRSSSPSSWTCTMLGCESFAAMRASSRNMLVKSLSLRELRLDHLDGVELLEPGGPGEPTDVDVAMPPSASFARMS